MTTEENLKQEHPEDCAHDCSSCASSCASRDPASLLIPANSASRIGKVFAVMSGKGGVGKSSVTAGLAISLSRMGYKVAILDADLTGPSIPRAFGLHGKAEGTKDGILPQYSKEGIAVMSLNFLLQEETDPVIWRGGVLAAVIQQFWSDVIWGEIDYMLIDMPPGTGDIPLTVLQNIPVDGVLVVTSPQDLVSMIVQKAVKMAQMLEKPVLGLVENYSYFDCPDCGKRHYIYGQSKLESIAKEQGLPILAQLPLDASFAEEMDAGRIESLPHTQLREAAETLVGKGGA